MFKVKMDESHPNKDGCTDEMIVSKSSSLSSPTISTRRQKKTAPTSSSPEKSVPLPSLHHPHSPRLHHAHNQNLHQRYRTRPVIVAVYFVFFVSVLLWMMRSENSYLALVLNSILPSDSNHDITNEQQKDVEGDYVFIFYSLLGINFIASLPSLWKVLRSLLKKTKHMHNDDDEDNNITEQQQTQEYYDENQRLIHHKLFYQTYLPAYLLATCADWLQGPYKYALYSSYGYTQKDIAHLFVVGYGSGMVLGSVVGGLADVQGRKKLCLGYCVAYTLSVTMTHFKNYYLLLLGRVGGGVGTSLLFSVFESWLIRAHGERGLVKTNSTSGDGAANEGDERWLAKSLSVSMYGSSLVAIVSGVLANFVVARSGSMHPLDVNNYFGYVTTDEEVFYVGGFVAAFDVCLPVLLICAILIMVLWEENYGEAHSQDASAALDEHDNSIVPKQLNFSVGYAKKHSSMYFDDDTAVGDESNAHKMESQTSESEGLIASAVGSQHGDGMFAMLWNGILTTWQTPEILMCCIIGSFFEGSMYIFIFLWTPALTAIQTEINQHGDENGKTYKDNAHDDDELPFGWIFSSFMVCCMLGTMAFSQLSNAGISASKCLVGILALSSISCVAMACPFHGGSDASGAYSTQYLGMLLYEFCIGAYYPAMGTVKGTIVPEDQRAAIYNVFRLPLNLLVLLYLVGDFSTQLSFLANAMLLLVSCVLQYRIVQGSGSGDNVGYIMLRRMNSSRSTKAREV